MWTGSTHKLTAIQFFEQAVLLRKRSARGRVNADAVLCLRLCLWVAPSFLVLKLSTASPFAPSTDNLNCDQNKLAAALLKKRSARGRVNADAVLCLGKYLWAAPSFLVLKLWTASASSQNAFRPWAKLFGKS